MAGVTLAGARQLRLNDVRQRLPAFALNPTPMPATLLPIPKPTATIDPTSIGDTSGVIVIGLLVVFVILSGVLWGSYELKMEIRKSRTPKE